MKNSIKINPTFIDIFSGCGGLSLGLLNAGWKGLFAVEKNADAFSSYKANLIDGKKCNQLFWPPGVPAKEMSIGKFLELLKGNQMLVRHLKNVGLVAGGPPCQGFSFAGRREHDDPRNSLFRDYLKVIDILRPSLLLIENVRGIAVAHSDKRVPYAEKIKQGLDKLGYEVFAGPDAPRRKSPWGEIRGGWWHVPTAVPDYGLRPSSGLRGHGVELL